MSALLGFGADYAGETIGDVVHGRIRTDILFGHLPPGERLRLDAVSRRYGASVGTMRELLNRLASEGLIVAEGQRGFEVAPVSPKEFREVGALRLLLETHALTQSFAAGDLDWEARVVAAHHKLSVMETRMIGGADADPVAWKQCDRDFHQALISACGSGVLMAAHSSVYDKYLRYQMIAIVFRGEAAAREHGLLLECALRRDAERANGILKTHIESCLDHALAEDPPGWALPPARTSTEKPRGTRGQQRRPAGRGAGGAMTREEPRTRCLLPG